MCQLDSSSDLTYRGISTQLPFNVGILKQVYDRVIRVIETHADPEDAKLARVYLDDAMV